LRSKFTIATSSAATASLRSAPTTTRYNKVVSKDSRRTLSRKKNLKDAGHL
jgi:hypothetical protein